MRANLLRAVSHDLRTPLTSISTAASLLSSRSEDIPPERRRAMLEEISDDAQWLIRMVENLLSITRVGGAADVRKTPEAAEEVISEAVRKYRARFDTPAASVSLPEELVMVPMDAILIRQVLSNLLENAAFHAEGAKNVRVTLRAEGDMAVFEVCRRRRGHPRSAAEDALRPLRRQPRRQRPFAQQHGHRPERVPHHRHGPRRRALGEKPRGRRGPVSASRCR